MKAALHSTILSIFPYSNFHSRVFLAKSLKSEEKVALKLFTYSAEHAENESRLHQSLSHPRILCVKDFFVGSFSPEISRDEPQSFAALVLENAPKGDLFELVRAFGRFPEAIARTYFHQIIDALTYLHEVAHISHRDIKPENILLDNHFGVKLADFGAAVDISQSKDFLITGNQGTQSYFSPERNRDTPYNGYQADLFALGIMLFVMVSGCRPFEVATEEDDMYNLIIQGNQDDFWLIHEELKQNQCPSSRDYYSPEFKDFINEMLSFDVNERNERLSLSEMKKHPWYKGATLSDSKLESLIGAVVHKMCL